MKEYDIVELINNREEYAQEGVTAGMLGTLIDERTDSNSWLVNFTEMETGNDIASILVNADDLILRQSADDQFFSPSPRDFIDDDEDDPDDDDLDDDDDDPYDDDDEDDLDDD